MKKETLLEIILGTIGGLVFAIGMCMCLIPEWNLFNAGVVVATLGFIILLCIIPIYRKSRPKKESKPINWGFVFAWVIGVIGALIYGIFKLTTGIYYKSAWFITFAAYYLLLCIMKINLISNFRKDALEHNLQKEYQKLKHTGIILLLDIVLSGMIILIIHKNETFTYPGTLIYLVALYDFYLIITAIINIIKYHNHKSPILTASKCINLTVAMISIISLEVAMIYQFGDNDITFKNTMIGITGFAVAIINSSMAIYMILKSKKRKQRIFKA